MGLRKKINGGFLAANVVRGWSNETLKERGPRELALAYSLSLADAEKIIMAERRKRGLSVEIVE